VARATHQPVRQGIAADAVGEGGPDHIVDEIGHRDRQRQEPRYHALRPSDIECDAQAGRGVLEVEGVTAAGIA
jgi:hypothetical protein